MHILLVTDEMLLGGVTRHILDVSKGLINHGMKVTIASSSERPNTVHKNIGYLKLDFLYEDLHRKKYFGIQSSVKKINKYIEEENVDVIHSHKRYSDLISSWCAYKTRIPQIVTVHSLFQNKLFLPHYEDHSIAICQAIKNNFLKNRMHRNDSISVIYNGIEITENESVVSPEISNRIVCIANFLPVKNHEYLLDAIKIIELELRKKNIKFVFRGEGEGKKFVIEYSKKNGVYDLCDFDLDKESIYSLVQSSLFMVLPSKQEGYPYVMLEAASYGKPMIATDVGGIDEFISHNVNGQIVPLNQKMKLADALIYYIDNLSIVVEHGGRAKQKVMQIHSFETFIQKTIDVYKKVVQ